MNCREATCLSYPSYSFLSPKMAHRLATPMKLFDITHHACKCTLPCVQTTISNKVKCWVTKRYRVSRCRFRIKGSSSSSRGKQVKLDTLGSLGKSWEARGTSRMSRMSRAGNRGETWKKMRKTWVMPVMQSCLQNLRKCLRFIQFIYPSLFNNVNPSILWSSGPSARFCTLRAGTA